MNASSLTCSRERTVHDASHAALRVAYVLFASPLLGLFGVGRTSKVRPFSARQRGPLFCFGFVGRNGAEPRVAQFGLNFVSPFVFTGDCKKIGVPFSHMFALRQALKVFQTVIGFIAVNVVNLFGGVKTVHPTFSDRAVNKRIAHAQITAGMRGRFVGAMLSKNFPAARDSVKVIKGAVFHAIDCKATHAVSSAMTDMIPTRFKKECQHV